MKNAIREWFAQIIREELRKDREAHAVHIRPNRVDSPFNPKRFNEELKRSLRGAGL